MSDWLSKAREICTSQPEMVWEAKYLREVIEGVMAEYEALYAPFDGASSVSRGRYLKPAAAAHAHITQAEELVRSVLAESRYQNTMAAGLDPPTTPIRCPTPR